MEDNGTISERGPLGRSSVDRLIGLKYLVRSAILETHVIVQNSAIYFQGQVKIQNFCPSKISSYTVNIFPL